MRGVGIYYEDNQDVTYRQLMGAIINGIKYGTVVAVQQEEVSPFTFQLFQNYPNPFNGSTIIEYSVTKRSNVHLAVYDILGREVATLVNEEKESGIYSVQFTNNNLSSGLYFYRMKAGNVTISKTMLLLR